MGPKSTKHIDLSHIRDTSSSPQFISQRTQHDKQEFTLARSENCVVDTEEDFCSVSHKAKRATFLEPPALHDENSRDLFHQRSLESEKNEFTIAKDHQHRKKHKTGFDKIPNAERSASSRRSKKKSLKRNKSHDHPDASNNNKL